MENDFITYLVQTRQALNLSQRELGRRADISGANISQVESGSVQPTADFCIKIADALGENPIRLLRLAGHLRDIGATSEQHEQLLYDLSKLDPSDYNTVVRQIRGLVGSATARPLATPPPANPGWRPTPEQCDVVIQECPKVQRIIAERDAAHQRAKRLAVELARLTWSLSTEEEREQARQGVRERRNELESEEHPEDTHVDKQQRR